jgi:hypothetical protein
LAWSFALDLKVQPATPLRLNPPLTSVGSWAVNVEDFELTPSVIHLHVVVEADLSGVPQYQMLDVFKLSGASEMRYNRIGPVTATGTEYLLEWARPGVATTLQLVVTGGGGTYSADVPIPAPAKN